MANSSAAARESLFERIQANQSTLAALFDRAFPRASNIGIESSQPWQTPMPDDLTGAGLIFVFRSRNLAGLAIYPESAGLLSLESKPDPVREAQLREFTSGLGSLVLGEPVGLDDCTVARVEDLRQTLEQCVASASAVLLPMRVERDGKEGRWFLGFPVDSPEQMIARQVASSAQQSNPSTEETASATPGRSPKGSQRTKLQYSDLEEGLRLLPAYARSLLKIRVPVTVTLATAKQSLETVLNIGSGSIIHFNKSCEDTLTLEVSGRPVAVGETVKVGDKFGLWITSMILPDERFWIIGRRLPPVRAK